MLGGVPNKVKYRLWEKLYTSFSDIFQNTYTQTVIIPYCWKGFNHGSFVPAIIKELLCPLFNWILIIRLKLVHLANPVSLFSRKFSYDKSHFKSRLCWQGTELLVVSSDFLYASLPRGRSNGKLRNAWRTPNNVWLGAGYFYENKTTTAKGWFIIS